MADGGAAARGGDVGARRLPARRRPTRAPGGGAADPASSSGAPDAPADATAATSSTAATAASLDDVIDGRLAVGTTVTVRGHVVPSTGGCLDVVCTTASGCCGTCTADAVLSPAPTLDGERFVWLTPRDPDTSPDAIGRCHDSDDCALTCAPPTGVVVEVTGEIIDAGAWRGLRVDRAVVVSSS